MNKLNIYNLVEQTYKFESEWKVITYKFYGDYINSNLDSNANDISYLIKYIRNNPQRKNFKWPIEIGSVQFLAGIFPKEKIIRIASKQLHYELNLINVKEDDSDQLFIDMKNHALSLAEIPLENSPTVIEFNSFKYDLPLFNEDKFAEIHQASEVLEKKLISKVSEYRQSLFEKVSDFGLDLTANFMLIRIHMLKFLAILPNLDHDKKGTEVKRIFMETVRRLMEDSNLAYRKKLKGQKQALPYVYILICKLILFVSQFIPAKFLAQSLRFSVGLMAKRFIAGETITKAETSLFELQQSGREATIDQLGELVVSNKEADEYTDKVIEIIEGLALQTAKGSKNAAGINKAHVSIKVSALCNDFKPQDFNYTYDNVSPRLKRILCSGMENDVFVNIDAEHYHYRDIVFRIYSKVLLDNNEFINYAQTGIVVQAYLRDGIEHLLEVVELAKSRKLLMPIRLVKGAYWDAETIEADAHNFLAPQFLNKEETDIHFRQLVLKTLENGTHIQLALASHNIQDHSFAEALREKEFPSAPVIEHQCLHMTYEALSMGLSKMGWPTRNYIPVGNLLVGMAYLVRRIMENSSQVGVLTIMRSHKKGVKIKNPTQVLKNKKTKGQIAYDNALAVMTREFKNIYPVRTYINNHFERVNSKLTQDLEKLRNKELFIEQGDQDVLCSSDPSILLGKIKNDTTSEVNEKIERLFNGYKSSTWKDNKNLERYASLSKLADLMLFRREELTSLIMLEAGKTIDEAIADVDEAIDFVNFYQREQISLCQSFNYQSRGVVGVIAPWNFPLAILCGMSVAALAAGNSVIVKPAEQTPLIALKFKELCLEAGIPEESFQMSLGEAEVGKAIVDHELVVGIVFTGSKQVGESIYKKVTAQTTSDKYDYDPIPKFAITEMGGKNAILVTNNSELDETVSGIIYSAFAHSGQKCSAASRVIIDSELKDAFLARFSNAVNDIKVGQAWDYSTVINPLITQEDQTRVREMATQAKEEVQKLGGKVILDRSREDLPGYCVGPSVFEISANNALTKNTVANQEVFGPLVHIIPYETIDQGIEIFNSTEYALTGGVFCQSQDDIDYILPKLEVGNIYINRPNTGARVAIEPFGGFKMSGTGPKAGGKDYLKIFNRVNSSNINSNIELDGTEIREDMAYTSKLARSKRIEIIAQTVTILMEQFESYFSSISEQNKDVLKDFLTALRGTEFNLDERTFPNRYIPGQLSYNKNNIPLGNGVVVDCGERVQLKFVVDLLTNLAIGNGISIISTNENNYSKLNSIVKLLYANGVSTYNLSHSILRKDSLKTILKSEDFDFVLFSSVNVEKEFKEIILNREFKKNMLKVFYSGQSADWRDGILNFTHARSFAINTMRHGAPLELTL